jgi:chromosome partitioning protein
VTDGGNPVYVHLLPAGPNLRLVEREMLYSLSKKKFDMEAIDRKLSDFFVDEFSPLRQHFDVIIFDCAPGISPFTEIAIRSSDMVIVPTIPDRMSAFGLKGFCEIVARQMNSGENSALPRLLFTRVQANVRQHREVEATLRQSPDFDPFDTIIPQCAALAEGIFVYDDSDESNETKYIPTMVGKYGRPMVTALTKLADEVWRAL